MDCREVKKFYDIILMDCNLPAMCGFQSTMAIKDLIRKKAIPDLKLIAATADVAEEDHQKCRKIWNGLFSHKFTSEI